MQSFSSALEAVIDKRLVKLPEVAYSGGEFDTAVAGHPVETLNTTPMTVGTQHVKHVVEIMPHTAVPFTFARVKTAMTELRFSDLPSPLSLRSPYTKEYSLQFAIVPEADRDTFTIVKHMHFADDVTFARIRQLTHGELFKIDWGGMDIAEGRKAFQFLFAGLGGCQACNFTLDSIQQAGLKRGGSHDKPFLSATQIDEGYDYIKQAIQHLERKDNAIGRFIMKQQHDPTSKVHTWTKAEIHDAIKNVNAEADFAAVHTEHMLTLFD